MLPVADGDAVFVVQCELSDDVGDLRGKLGEGRVVHGGL